MRGSRKLGFKAVERMRLRITSAQKPSRGKSPLCIGISVVWLGVEQQAEGTEMLGHTRALRGEIHISMGHTSSST
jgi:hypothetical protein